MDALDFDAKMTALRSAFRTRAENDATELEVLTTAVPTAEQLERIQHLAHRIVGGAATFGIPELTAPAMQLETEVIERGPDVNPLAAALIAMIRTCVERINADEADNAV